MLLSLHSSNALAKSDSTIGNGTCVISFLTTDNCLMSLIKNTALVQISIGVNQFLSENATSFADYSLEIPDHQNQLCKFGENSQVSNASYL